MEGNEKRNAARPHIGGGRELVLKDSSGSSAEFHRDGDRQANVNHTAVSLFPSKTRDRFIK